MAKLELINGRPRMAEELPYYTSLKSIETAVGSTQYLEIPNTAKNLNFGNTDAFSFFMWLYIDTSNEFTRVLWHYDGTNGYFLDIISDEPRLILQTNGGTNRIRVQSDVSVPVGEWFTLGFTYDGSELASGVTIYINNSAVAATVAQDNLTAGSIKNNNSYILMNQDPPSDTNAYAGNMSNFAIWSKELSSSEISTLHNTKLQKNFSEVAPKKLELYLLNGQNDDLEVADGIKDISGKGNHATGNNLVNSTDLVSDVPDAAALQLPLNSDPNGNISNPKKGEMAFDSIDNEAQVYDGTSWLALVAGTAVGAAGSVQFSAGGGAFLADNPNFFWDDSNNRLGIGTNTPATDLHVNHDSASAEVTVESSASGFGSELRLDGNPSAADNSFGEIQGLLAGDLLTNIEFVRGSAADASYMTFFTQASGGSLTERMRIGEDGSIRIGDTPGAATNMLEMVSGTRRPILTLDGTAGVASTRPALELKGDLTTANGSVANIDGYWNGNRVASIIFLTGADTANKDDGHISFYTSASGPAIQERVRITNAGEVLPGTDAVNDLGNTGKRWGELHVANGVRVGDAGTPSALLEVVDTTQADVSLIATGNGATLINGDSNRTASDQGLFAVFSRWNGNQVAAVVGVSGANTTNKDEGYLEFRTRDDGEGNPVTKVRITQEGILESLNETIMRGAVQKRARTVSSSPYAPGADDHYIIVDTSTIAITINLPSAATAFDTDSSREYVIKDNGNAAANNITINADGSDLIEGSGSTTISTNYGLLRLITDGTNWFVV